MLDYQYKTKPFAHQEQRFLSYRDKEYHAHLWEQGTGKTKVTIDTGAWLYGKGEIDLLLIVAPNGVHNTWIKDQVPCHMPDHTNYKAAYYASSFSKKEAEALEKVLRHRDGFKVISMNIEAFATKKGVAFARGLLNSHRTLFVVDESSTIKNPKAVRTKELLKLSIHAKYRRILTGTPITQGPLDIFTQFTFLDEHCLRTTSFYAFRNRYAIMKEQRANGRSFMTVTGYTNIDELQELIGKHSDRVTKDECLDLPEKLYVKHYVELTENQKKLYKTLKKDLIVEFNGATLTAPLALTKLLRLQQIVGGYFTSDPDCCIENAENAVVGDAVFPNGKALVLPVDEKNNRVESLIELLQRTEGKVIIWARFRAELAEIAKRLCEEFGKESVVQYHGGVDNAERMLSIERFQKDNSCKYFVGNVQSGGKGLTLTAASTVVYYSNTFSYEDRAQSEDRAHRIGQLNHVTYIDFIAKDTLDEKIVEVLRTKRNLADLITGDNSLDWI